MTDCLKWLEPVGEGVLPMVLDTDAYNEVDDQFALAYALLSPERLKVEAVYAAPFLNKRVATPREGMEKSLLESKRVIALTGKDTPVLPGQGGFGSSAQLSPAVLDLIDRARQPRQTPLYVVCIAAPTNVACALQAAPEIARNISVVWLGGHGDGYPDTREFNLMEDLCATRLLLNSGVALTRVPCIGVASQLWTSLAELERWLGGQNALCDELIAIFKGYRDDHFAWGKVLWDVAAVARLVCPDWVPAAVQASPLVTDDLHWARDARRHPILQAYGCQRNAIFQDLFQKLVSLA